MQPSSTLCLSCNNWSLLVWVKSFFSKCLPSLLHISSKFCKTAAGWLTKRSKALSLRQRHRLFSIPSLSRPCSLVHAENCTKEDFQWQDPLYLVSLVIQFCFLFTSTIVFSLWPVIWPRNNRPNQAQMFLFLSSLQQMDDYDWSPWSQQMKMGWIHSHVNKWQRLVYRGR
jgi:hypothetical protein